MNKTKIILRLQQIASTSSNPYELMSLAKAVEKLKAGSVSVVSTIASLPAAATSTVGEIYLVENDDDLYVNVGSQWNSLNNELLGIAYAWGSNNFGALGDGTTALSSISPVTVIGGITNWSQLSAGAEHSLGLTSTGIAYAWGRNQYGRLGDGTTTSRSSPVTVIGGITTWSQLAAGGNFSLGVTSTGIAYAWGYNTYGRLGDGTTTSRLSPVTVVGGITNWNRVSAGSAHSLGLTSAGVAYAWGFNDGGRLGDGTITNRSSPVTVVGGITNWSQVAAGQFHSLGLTSAGIAYAWGANNQGRLGDGTITNRSSPVTVIGGITNWSQLSAAQHSLGVTSTGIAYAWGFNTAGQLGNGNTTSTSSPVTVIGGITNWTQVSCGHVGYHSLGLTSTGIAYAWGGNNQGRLGDGTITNRSSPVTVIGGITNWSQLSASSAHSLGLRAVIKSR